MSKDFFVMLTTPDGGYTPMTIGDDNEMAKYDTEEEAKRAAISSLLGNHFGYEVFEIGLGTCSG